MRITHNDIAFAERKAYKRMFPAGFEKYLGLQQTHTTSVLIHSVINGHVEKLTHSRYMWANTLRIIKGRTKRGEEWIDIKTWFPGSPSSNEHITLVKRIVRRMRRNDA